jgi:hypothetical protein
VKFRLPHDRASGSRSLLSRAVMEGGARDQREPAVGTVGASPFIPANPRVDRQNDRHAAQTAYPAKR